MTKTFANLRATIFDGHGQTVAGIEAHDCFGVTWRNWNIVGGPNNFRGQKLVRCVIEDCKMSAPDGPVDPDGFGHGVQFDDCDSSIIRRCAITAGDNSEDRVNLYKSRDCRVLNCLIVGHGKSGSGNGITLDYDCQRAIIRNNIVDPSNGWGGIVIADGCGHIVDFNEVRNCGCCYTVRCTYDDAGNTVADDATQKARLTRHVRLTGNKALHFTDLDYFVDPFSTADVVIVKG